MRVPVYEVKINGNSIKAFRISITQRPKNYVFQAIIQTPETLPLSSDVEISFFNLPLIRGKVLKERQTSKIKEYQISLKTPKIPKTYIANKPLREGFTRKRFVYGKNAIELFKALFAQYGYSLYFDEAPPLICYGREVEGDLVQILADYFKDFAPLISIDPVSNTVYILFKGLDRVWNIPDKVIFDFEITREERDINAVVITNGVKKEKEKEKEEEKEKSRKNEHCGKKIFFETKSSSGDTETINTYEINLEEGNIRLIKSETIQYGNVPFTTVQLLVEAEFFGAGEYELWRRIVDAFWEGRLSVRGVVSKTITEYNNDGTYSSIRYGWVPRVRKWVFPYGVGLGFLVDFYEFVPVSETVQKKNVQKRDLGCYILEKTTIITETKEYVYRLRRGGDLTLRDILKFRNLLPGDKEDYATTKVDTSESIRLIRKDTKESSIFQTEISNDIIGGYAATNVRTSHRKEWNPLPVEEIIPIESTPPERGDKFLDIPDPSTSYVVKVEHEDIDLHSLAWARERVKEMYKKHSLKATLKIPLIPVKIGEKVFALQKLWIIEGFSHEITPNTAITVLYVREA